MIFDRVYREAAETFGKKRGHRNPLTPYTRTWKLVLSRSEHALWVWNDKYGPLNASQREYAEELLAYALTEARSAPDCNSTYAFFNATLTRLLNHETVDAGFKRREESDEGALADVIDLDGIYAAA